MLIEDDFECSNSCSIGIILSGQIIHIVLGNRGFLSSGDKSSAILAKVNKPHAGQGKIKTYPNCPNEGLLRAYLKLICSDTHCQTPR